MWEKCSIAGHCSTLLLLGFWIWDLWLVGWILLTCCNMLFYWIIWNYLISSLVNTLWTYWTMPNRLNSGHFLVHCEQCGEVLYFIHASFCLMSLDEGSIREDRECWRGQHSREEVCWLQPQTRLSDLATLLLLPCTVQPQCHTGKSFTKWPTAHYDPNGVQHSGSIWQMSDWHAKGLHQHQGFSVGAKWSPIQIVTFEILSFPLSPLELEEVLYTHQSTSRVTLCINHVKHSLKASPEKETRKALFKILWLLVELVNIFTAGENRSSNQNCPAAQIRKKNEKIN